MLLLLLLLLLRLLWLLRLLRCCLPAAGCWLLRPEGSPGARLLACVSALRGSLLRCLGGICRDLVWFFACLLRSCSPGQSRLCSKEGMVFKPS